MKKTILFIVVCFSAMSLLAQYTVSGKVVSATDGSQLEMSTVRLFAYHNGDSTMVQGAQTDFEGEYYLTNVKNGQYKLFVSNIGFREQVVSVTVAGSDVSLKSIRLREDVQHLAEVQVQWKAAEMTVKGDTI